MQKPKKGLDHRAYRRTTKRLRSTASVCWICTGVIDKDLPPEHPESWTADHVVPRSKGGRVIDPTNLRAAHRSCNSKRGNKQATKADLIPTTRQW